MISDLSNLTGEAFCYLTTTGRVSGRPHTIEMWFALSGSTLYMLSGGMNRADWVKNAWRLPEVTVKIKERIFAGQARPVNDPAEDALARQLIEDKYHESEEDLDEWLKSALPVAIDLVG
jgi:deazaflavin-dependent oxidoreductase (nitroreductase family)